MSEFQSRIASSLKTPLTWSGRAGLFFLDLWNFHKNAGELLDLKNKVGQSKLDQIQREELLQENARLRGLLDLKPQTPTPLKQKIFCRVLARSPYGWNRTVLLDKGARQGVHPTMLALAEYSVIGKVVECGASVSKIMLLSDPNSRLGVMVQRTRQEGILYGSLKGEIRIKYLSLDAAPKPGDVVLTAGMVNFYPKGLPLGTIARVWREPGQIHQTAEVKPFADLGRVEEVLLVES